MSLNSKNSLEKQPETVETQEVHSTMTPQICSALFIACNAKSDSSILTFQKKVETHLHLFNLHCVCHSVCWPTDTNILW